jgi:hypothetical protein
VNHKQPKGATVSNLIQIYSLDMPVQGSKGALLRNPLIKNKGRIRDDWTMPDERSNSTEQIVKKPFQSLFNSSEENNKLKTKTQAAQQLNYSSFNDRGKDNSSLDSQKLNSVPGFEQKS